jgi:hypothetical protein
MVQIECPFCEQPCRMEVTAFTADVASLRCDACSVEVEFEGAQESRAMAMAA